MADKKMNFETSLSQLEETVKALESGEMSLDESIALYEKGIKLSSECAEALKNAKQRIIMLSDAEKEEAE